MYLAIDDYNKKESLSMCDLPNRFIRAFRPLLFEQGGFPTRVATDVELNRYVDSMHANSFSHYYNDLCHGITLREFELLKKTVQDIVDFTKKNYGFSFAVKDPMIVSLFEKRLLEAISSDKDKTIFEIGGGSGILGALLINDGFKYASTDVTQAFYLLQNRLYNYLTDDGLNEMVLEEYDKDSRSIHIPYWKLWQDKDNPIDFNIVISNHALLEMNSNSIRFYLNYCYDILKKNKGCFVFQGGGWGIDKNLVDLICLFEEYGYRLQYFDHSKEIGCFGVSGDSVKDKVVNELKSLYKDSETKVVNGLGEILADRLPQDMVFRTGYFGKRLKDGLNSYDKHDKLDINTVSDYYDQLSCDKVSLDSEFTEYIKVRQRGQ